MKAVVIVNKDIMMTDMIHVNPAIIVANHAIQRLLVLPVIQPIQDFMQILIVIVILELMI